MIRERKETLLERNVTRLERNETRLERNDTRLARNETRSGNFDLSGTVHEPYVQHTCTGKSVKDLNCNIMEYFNR